MPTTTRGYTALEIERVVDTAFHFDSVRFPGQPTDRHTTTIADGPSLAIDLHADGFTLGRVRFVPAGDEKFPIWSVSLESGLVDAEGRDVYNIKDFMADNFTVLWHKIRRGVMYRRRGESEWR